MPRKVHAIGQDDSTECKIRFALFPRVASTTDLSAVTCKGCLGAVRRRTEAVARSEIARRAVDHAVQLDLMTRKDLTELRTFIEGCFSSFAHEVRHPPIQRYMGVNECAAYIGRSPKAVRHLVEQRAIPHSRFDRRLIFDREKIDRWIARRSMRVLAIRW
jgi:hypothetical protein